MVENGWYVDGKNQLISPSGEVVIDQNGKLVIASADSLGIDINKGFSQMEADHAARYQDKFNVKLVRSTHVGADYVIAETGQSVDAMGPFPSQHFSIRQVTNSLTRHLRKSVDRISIDATGLSPEQKEALRHDIDKRTEEERNRIDTIGLD